MPLREIKTGGEVKSEQVESVALDGHGDVFGDREERCGFVWFGWGAVLSFGGLEQPRAAVRGHTSQVFRYDDAERLIECISCTSGFDPEPRLSALFA